jgi:hypothetical protein
VVLWGGLTATGDGYVLSSSVSGPGVLSLVGLVAQIYHANTTTYDLTIDGLHTYYVVAGGTPVLVHNTNDPIPGACTVPGLSVFDIPSGSSNGPGAFQPIPESVRQEYGTGVQWHPPLNQPLCSYCRTNLAVPIDHVEPRIYGGDLTDANTTLACTFCNSSKRDRIAPMNAPPNYVG